VDRLFDDNNRCQGPIFLIRCPHREQITVEWDDWCSDCKDWVDGIEVGEFCIFWRDDGTIDVDGGGYCERKG